MRGAALILAMVSSACGLFSSSQGPRGRPELRSAPVAMAGAPLYLPPPELRGPEARHAIDVAAELHQATARALGDAGFVVLHAPQQSAAEANVALVVDYCFVDVARIEAHVLVTRDGRQLGSFTIPADELPTRELPATTAILIANEMVGVDALGRATGAPAADRDVAATPVPAVRESVVVAILDLQDPDRALRANERTQLTDYLTAHAIQQHGWKSVPRAQLREQLQQEKAASYESCVDEACQIELGKAVAAQKTLVTKLLRLGKACTMVMTLYDLRSEAAEAAATTKTGCTATDLTAGIDDLLSKLARP